MKTEVKRNAHSPNIWGYTHSYCTLINKLFKSTRIHICTHSHDLCTFDNAWWTKSINWLSCENMCDKVRIWTVEENQLSKLNETQNTWTSIISASRIFSLSSGALLGVGLEVRDGGGKCWSIGASCGRCRFKGGCTAGVEIDDEIGASSNAGDDWGVKKVEGLIRLETWFALLVGSEPSRTDIEGINGADGRSAENWRVEGDKGEDWGPGTCEVE